MFLSHITIFTDKLNSSIDFYQSVIGLNIARDLREGSLHKVVFLTDANGSVCIELAENTDNPYAGHGISIGFSVDDLTETAKKLQNSGFTPGPVISPNLNTRFFFIQDPNGVDIQFVEEKKA